MRTSPLNYLSIIVLIVSRLILGELAYAMPQEAGSLVHLAPSTTVVAPHCPEHRNGQPQMQASVHSEMSDTAQPGVVSTHDTQKDCCKSSGCKCPCAHLTAMAVPTLAAASHGIAEARLGPSVAAPANDRLSALFRPPA